MVKLRRHFAGSTALLLASNAAASPLLGNLISSSPVSLPFARRVNTTGVSNMVQLDKARAQALRAKAEGGSGSTGVFNDLGDSQAVNYVVTVSIGNPPTDYELLVDTGSSNTWVGAGQPYQITSTSKPTLSTVHVDYGSGKMVGTEWIDTITIGGDLTIADQSIGVAAMTRGFDGVDGILGVGPTDLTCGTLTDTSECIPTVLDSANDQGLLDSYMLGISFKPTNMMEEVNGVLTFGGVDDSRYVGELHWVPLTTTEPANQFVGIDQDMLYGTKDSTTVLLEGASGIVDTGTSLLLIASDAFQQYLTLTGATPDDATGLLKIDPKDYAKVHSLWFRIGQHTYELTREAQTWPRSLNGAMGGDEDAIYLVVNDLGCLSGSGLDFINGMVWLERFYAVFDVGGGRVGFAPAPWSGGASS
ncbi:hypothetical protein CERSUDRAFT_137265 [Gelatoporia subvermispora B]|uniref:Peptidase A1 domain-containing protein n=1 Tax=Ceriporiopsis subvermispora (strain B) TaxID=914234 RepID=M2QIT3_CERS8|nr:hypothetical protein CERSUDRAFT_137265 [Gelatoporia subvermispora B]